MGYRRAVKGKIPKRITVNGRRVRVIRGKSRKLDLKKKSRSRMSRIKPGTRKIRLNRGDYFKVYDKPGGKVIGYL